MNYWRQLNKKQFWLSRHQVQIPNGKKVQYTCRCGKNKGILIGKYYYIMFCNCEPDGFLVKTFNGEINDYNIHTIGLLK